MKQRIFQIEYAGNLVRYSFVFPGTRYCFRPLPRFAEGTDFHIRATREQIQHTRGLLPPDSSDSYAEYRTMIPLTSQELLRNGCCIFHAVSFLWRDYAWLLTAPSGTGKTTQYLNWQRLFPGEIQMICGDMPVLERRHDGSVWVWPSSWNGKEGLGNHNLSAPLAGIVLLEQGRENLLVPQSLGRAVIPCFQQFMVRPETEDQIGSLSVLIAQMLRAAPFWKFTNLGDDASTAMLREAFSRRARELEGEEDDTL